MTPAARLHGLYVITDTLRHQRDDLVEAVEAAIAGGARVVQYRDKSADPARRRTEAGALQRLARKHDVLFLINDDVALARRVGADGVHLGRDDQAIVAARQALGSDAIIGASCYDRLALAHQAIASGADYCAFGAVFPSGTKPDAAAASLDLLRQARDSLPVPICAIGGITAENAGEVVDAGAHMLAVIAAVFAAEDVAAAARRICLASGCDRAPG